VQARRTVRDPVERLSAEKRYDYDSDEKDEKQ
jgi:hypothetical protein